VLFVKRYAQAVAEKHVRASARSLCSVSRCFCCFPRNRATEMREGGGGVWGEGNWGRWFTLPKDTEASWIQ